MKKIYWLAFWVVVMVFPELALAVDVSTYSFNSGMDCQGVWRLPDTGLVLHYSTATGDDSDYRPAATQMSYTILNPVGISSVTVDNVTGLMWITNPRTDAGFKGAQTWESALTSCTVTLNGMAYAGYTDWRLPNIRELHTIAHLGKASGPYIDTTAFPATVSNTYWSSTTFSPVTTNTLNLNFSIGGVASGSKTFSYYVRCVRGGQ